MIVRVCVCEGICVIVCVCEGLCCDCVGSYGHAKDLQPCEAANGQSEKIRSGILFHILDSLKTELYTKYLE